MKLTAILLTLFVLKSCGTTKHMAESYENESSKMVQNVALNIEYSAMTRGSYKLITIKDNILSYQNNRTEAPTTRTCSDEEINNLLQQLNTLDLDKLTTLEAPSQKFQYDGALIARLTVTQEENEYKVPIFDHGNPHEYIANFVKTILSMPEKH